MAKGSHSKDPKMNLEQGYDQVAAQYVRLEEGDGWPRTRWLEELLRALPPGTFLLDLGCGSGGPAGILVAQNHILARVDLSREQIKCARRNVPFGTFLHADAASIQFPDASFDAVVSFYTLEHIPRAEHVALLASIHPRLRACGLLLVSLDAGEAEGMVGEWLGAPMFFSCFDPETMVQKVRVSGFEILETAVETQIEQGIEIPYLWAPSEKAERAGPFRHWQRQPLQYRLGG